MVKTPHKQRRGGCDVLSQPIGKEKPIERLRKLTTAHRAGRLQLALAGAREAAFDWTLADDQIAWDGAHQLLSVNRDPEQLAGGEHLRAWMGEAGRETLRAVTDQS